MHSQGESCYICSQHSTLNHPFPVLNITTRRTLPEEYKMKTSHQIERSPALRRLQHIHTCILFLNIRTLLLMLLHDRSNS